MPMKKSEIKTPVLPEETLEVPALGGSVRCQGMLLRDRIGIFADAEERGPGYWHVARLLSKTVVDDDGAPLFAEAEWEIFGAAHFEQTMQIYAVCKRLNGLDAEGAKKN